MTPFTQLAGLYGPKDDTARQLYRVAINCGIEAWDEYVVCRNEDELKAFMTERDLVSGKGNYSVEVICLTSVGLDSLWISS
jgi:hypothetical protein